MNANKFPRFTERLRISKLEPGSPTLNQVLDSVMGNPLSGAYAKGIRSGVFRNTQGWHAQGEKLATTLVLLDGTDIRTTHFIGSQQKEFDANTRFAGDIGYTPEELKGLPSAFTFLHALRNSAVYLWTDKIHRIAVEMPLPKHTIHPEILPYPSVFFSFETAWTASNPDQRHIVEGETNFILLIHSETHQGIIVVSDLQHTNEELVQHNNHVGGGLIPKMSLTVSVVKYGATFPNDFEHPLSMQPILSMLAFLDTSIIENRRAGFSRASRRELERTTGHNEDWSDPKYLTNIVDLRRKEKRPVKTDDDGEKIARQFQWWTTGHWRNQWYPSKGIHKLKWIPQHLNGPTDKPIREKTYRVIR